MGSTLLSNAPSRDHRSPIPHTLTLTHACVERGVKIALARPVLRPRPWDAFSHAWTAKPLSSVNSLFVKNPRGILPKKRTLSV